MRSVCNPRFRDSLTPARGVLVDDAAAPRLKNVDYYRYSYVNILAGRPSSCN